MIGALNSAVNGISLFISDVVTPKMSFSAERSIILVVVLSFCAIFWAASVSLIAICPYLIVNG
jgi:hypothetical protein